jgi:hypothetical protein
VSKAKDTIPCLGYNEYGSFETCVVSADAAADAVSFWLLHSASSAAPIYPGLPSCCCSCLLMVQGAGCISSSSADSTASASLASNPAAPAAAVAVLLLQQQLLMLLVYRL